MKQFKTRGIVLHRIKYSESSVIAKIYTEAFGLESFIVKGIRSSKSKVKQTLLDHLSLVDLEIYHNERGGLQQMKEIKSGYVFKTIPFEIIKSSIALFINEILYKSLKEEIKNEELFEFIYNSIIKLDELIEQYTDFHFHFLIELAKHLGTMPNNNYTVLNPYFNIKEGLFRDYADDETYCMNNRLSEEFYKLIESNVSAQYIVPVKYRKELLKKIVDYYKYHITGENEIKSHEVLSAVLGA